MGSLYKRGTVWWVKYSHRGRVIRESSGSDRKMVARALLTLREGELAAGKLPRVDFERVTFDDLAASLVADYKVNGRRSLDRVEQALARHLTPFFGGCRVPDITTDRVKAYIADRLEAGAANATVNRELAYLKRALNLGAAQTPPRVDRVPHVPMLKENNVRKGFFGREEFLALHAALPAHLKTLVLFAYKTGWRLSEIRGLTWDRIDMKGGTVRLEAGETKNDAPRTVFMDEELHQAMRAQFSKRRLGCPHVFTRGGKPIADFRGSWETACRRAGVGGRLFHDLRRTAVRNMVRAGVPERVAMSISGHKTRSVFDRYNIVNEDDLRRAAMQQEEYLASLAGTILGTVPGKKEKKGHG